MTFLQVSGVKTHLQNHLTDSKQRCTCALSSRRPSSHVQNRHQNRPGRVSEEICHNKSPCTHLQRVCITPSAVLRFSSSGDMSYSPLSETTLSGFIAMAQNSELKKIFGWKEKKRGRKINRSILLWTEAQAFGRRTAAGSRQRWNVNSLEGRHITR